MIDILKQTPYAMLEEIKERFRSKRLSLGYTQEGLALRSGVSLGSLKIFEKKGQISLISLLKLAFVLECLDDFKNLARPHIQTPQSIDELLLSKKPLRKRGSKK
jgi:transcriptional regulator with XRE-family HTH domain